MLATSLDDNNIGATICATATITMAADVEHQFLMDRYARSPATASTTFSDAFWDTVDDVWVRSASATSDDDDDINVRLSWFQQLQLTPPIDTGSSHSDHSPVSQSPPICVS